MFEIEGRTSLYKITRQLVDVALGRVKADLVVRNGTLLNVNSGEILEKQDIAIKKDRIALVGDAAHTIGPDTQTLNASGKVLVPGFIDGDVHIESAMVSLSEFARAILPRGTTTIVIDPHDIVNVLGKNGVRLFLKEAKNIPLKTLVTFPSCVPSAPRFETSGAVISSADIRDAMEWNGVIGLGEMMDYPAVLSGERRIHDELSETIRAGKIIEGHAVDLSDQMLAAYVASGATSCHESTAKEQVINKVRLGMYAVIREGAIDLDLTETIRAVTEERLDPRLMVLTANDRDPRTLLESGHMDHVVRRAIEEGVDPVRAVQMATLNMAQHYECARELGSIAPARYADIVILDDLRSVSVDTVITDGRIVARNGKLLSEIKRSGYPKYATRSMHLRRPPARADLAIRSRKVVDGSVRIRVMGLEKSGATTRLLERESRVKNGEVQSDVEQDISKIAVFERHGITGGTGLGFVNGLEIKQGAAATTIAHDCHNLVVAGASDGDMILAAKTLIDSQGGMVIVKDNKVEQLVPLTIAGMISKEPIEVVSDQIEKLKEAWEHIGSSIPHPHVTLSITTLAVIPEVRITDKGLLDTVKFRFIAAVID